MFSLSPGQFEEVYHKYTVLHNVYMWV